MKKSKTLFLFLLPAIIFSSCNLYPDSEAQVEDLDVVLTNFDSKADFSKINTYSIMDVVVPVTNNSGDGQPAQVNSQLSELVISIINSNMQSFGYTRVDSSANPDIGINIGAVLTRNITVYTYYPDYYYWSDGYWYDPGAWWGYPGYGYYYPWYPVTSVSSYEIGTLMIDFVDLKQISTQDSSMKVVWSATLRGIVSASAASNRERVETNINQAFDQSPYLQKQNN